MQLGSCTKPNLKIDDSLKVSRKHRFFDMFTCASTMKSKLIPLRPQIHVHGIPQPLCFIALALVRNWNGLLVQQLRNCSPLVGPLLRFLDLRWTAKWNDTWRLRLVSASLRTAITTPFLRTFHQKQRLNVLICLYKNIYYLVLAVICILVTSEYIFYCWTSGD